MRLSRFVVALALVGTCIFAVDALAKQSPAYEQAGVAKGTTIKLGSTRFGKIAETGSSRAIYIFTKEKGKTPRCYGECAKAWPPVMTSGAPVAGKGISRSKLGTSKRKGGKTQVTYNGHPLYRYVNDKSAHEVRCQAVDEFGGIWYVIDGSGDAKK